MEKQKLKVSFSEKLNPEDTLEQTKGCRANNPDICGNNSVQGVCAYVREDGICKRPSRAWAKQYKKLKESEENDA